MLYADFVMEFIRSHERGRHNLGPNKYRYRKSVPTLTDERPTIGWHPVPLGERGGSPRGGVVFDSAAIKGRPIDSEMVRQRRLQVVPFEIRKAGRLLNKARTENHVSEGDITILLNKNFTTDDVLAFERGEGGIPLPSVYEAARVFRYETDEYMIGLREIIGDQIWMRTLASLEPPIVGDALVLLRIDQHLSQSKFAKNLDMTTQQLNNYELSVHPPGAINLRRIIEESALRPNSKGAQLLNLQIYPDEPNQPMPLDVLQTCGIGHLVKYLRRLKGVTVDELAEETLSCSPNTLMDLESEKYKRSFVMESSNTTEAFIKWLGLSSDSALAQVIQQKIDKPTKQIPERLLLGVMEEEYLFQEHIDQLTPNQLSPRDQSLIRRLVKKSSSRSKLNVVLHSTATKGIPQDYKAAEALGRKGRNCHDPVTKYLVDCIRQERLEKRKMRKGSQNGHASV